MPLQTDGVNRRFSLPQSRASRTFLRFAGQFVVVIVIDEQRGGISRVRADQSLLDKIHPHCLDHPDSRK